MTRDALCLPTVSSARQDPGLAPKPPAPSAVRKAFRAEAKLWHPDRFEKTPTRRAEAEEHFKRIQVAYRELLEHCESPVELWPRRTSAQPADQEQDREYDRQQDPLHAARRAPGDDSVPLSFGGAPYCFVPPHFSPYANEIILASRLENAEKVLAFIDVPGATSRGAIRGEYILLTSYRIIVRDALNHLSPSSGSPIWERFCSSTATSTESPESGNG